MSTPIRKKPSTYRLAQMTEMQISKLADQLGMSRANVIQTAVDRLYQQETQNMQWSKSKEEQMAQFLEAAKSLLPYTSGDEHTRLHQAADSAIEECAAELPMQQFAAIQERFGGDAALRDQIVQRLANQSN